MSAYLSFSDEVRLALTHARAVVLHDADRAAIALHTTVGIRESLLGLATVVPNLIKRYPNLGKLFRIWKAQRVDEAWWLPNRSPAPSPQGPIRSRVTKRALHCAFDRARQLRHPVVTADDLLFGLITITAHDGITWNNLGKKRRHEVRRLISELVADVSTLPNLIAPLTPHLNLVR